MRKTVLFIAVSLDGYIADPDGKVDWLEGEDKTADSGNTYEEFIKDIDTVIMGYKTYNQIITELSPDKWAYEGLKSYVITHRELKSSEDIEFTNLSPCLLIKKLREEAGKDIWICGGADIARQLIRENLIDKYYITIIPTILGSGIPLFGETQNEIKLRLIETKSCNGMVDLVYELPGGKQKASER